MTRAVWKLPYVTRSVWRHCDFWRNPPLYLQHHEAPLPWRSWSRRTKVTRMLLQHPIRLHTGKEFELVTPQREHIGATLGSLVLTKTIGSFVHKHNRLNLKKKKSFGVA